MTCPPNGHYVLNRPLLLSKVELALRVSCGELEAYIGVYGLFRLGCAYDKQCGLKGGYSMPVPLGKTPEPSQYARAFSAHVRMVMGRDGVTTQALADRLEISRTYLGKRLRDEMPFTLTDVEAICNALGIELPKLPDI